jgi:hypothetical protein
MTGCTSKQVWTLWKTVLASAGNRTRTHSADWPSLAESLPNGSMKLKRSPATYRGPCALSWRYVCAGSGGLACAVATELTGCGQRCYHSHHCSMLAICSLTRTTTRGTQNIPCWWNFIKHFHVWGWLLSVFAIILRKYWSHKINRYAFQVG